MKWDWDPQPLLALCGVLRFVHLRGNYLSARREVAVECAIVLPFYSAVPAMSLFGFFRTPSTVDSTAADAAASTNATSAGSEADREVTVQLSPAATESGEAATGGEAKTGVESAQASGSGGQELNYAGGLSGGTTSDGGSLAAGETAVQAESVSGASGPSDLEQASTALHSLLASSAATSSSPNLQETMDTADSQSTSSLLSTLLSSAPHPPPSSLPLPLSSSPLLTPASISHSNPTLLTPLAFSSPSSQPSQSPLSLLQAPSSAPPSADRTAGAPLPAEAASTSATTPTSVAESASTSAPSAPPLGTLLHPSPLSAGSQEPAFPLPPSQSVAARVADLLPWKRTFRGRGRFLEGSDAVLDVDKESLRASQLEVTPITVYGSEDSGRPGRQIAVNERYICYALRNAAVRVLNQQTALRALVKGHAGVSGGMGHPACACARAEGIDAHGGACLWHCG